MAFCNKCGFFGETGSDGIHKTPKGDPCGHSASKVYCTQLCERLKRILIDTTCLNLEAIGPRDPTELMDDLMRTANRDVVVEVLQSAIERNRICLDSQGFVTTVRKIRLRI